jgi:hypothetical protein
MSRSIANLVVLVFSYAPGANLDAICDREVWRKLYGSDAGLRGWGVPNRPFRADKP